MEKEKELLKQGEDYATRERICIGLKEIIKKSRDGEIGWGDFLGEVRQQMDEMETLCQMYWNRKD